MRCGVNAGWDADAVPGILPPLLSCAFACEVVVAVVTADRLQFRRLSREEHGIHRRMLPACVRDKRCWE